MTPKLKTELMEVLARHMQGDTQRVKELFLDFAQEFARENGISVPAALYVNMLVTSGLVVEHITPQDILDLTTQLKNPDARLAGMAAAGTA